MCLRLSALDVPVLVQASPDDLSQLFVQRRRDAFCGKISVCNNLRQYGIPFTLTERHTVALTSDEFKRELSDFVAVSRVVRGMTRARVGAIGARPNAFNTTRYSEKLLEASGISVSTLDLSEVLDGARRLGDTDPRVRQKLTDITGYAAAPGVPDPALILPDSRFAAPYSGGETERSSATKGELTVRESPGGGRSFGHQTGG